MRSGGANSARGSTSLNRHSAGGPMPANPFKVQDDASPSRSWRALDWLNFFLAALMMGFGPFVSVHLADQSWTPEGIGLVLTVSTLIGLIAQIPAGELIDLVKSKRALIGAGTAAAAVALLLFGLRSDFPSIVAAAVIQGLAASMLGPAIAAISLGLVGHDALAERLGRNQRFASIGGLAAAAVMGVVGYFLLTRDTFFLSAALWIPLLLALLGIRAADIHFGRSCGAPDHHGSAPPRVSRAVLFKDHRLLTFAICLFLFQLGNASLLSQLSQTLARAEGHLSSLIVSALVVGPQIVVALLAPLAGRTATSWGRRPLLVIGLAAVPIRAGLFVLTTDPTVLVALQLLDGLSGATLGVLTALVVADLTAGTGRFNLAQGLVGALSGVGASLSTSLSGLIVQTFGHAAGLLSVTAVGLLAVAVVLAFMPETKPPSPSGADHDSARHRARNLEPVSHTQRWLKG
jgi:MFS family permease